MNQAIAYNLKQARERAGLTQEQAAEKLEPFLGELWSKATWSAAENSYRTDRVRQFDADEIEAFAQCFGLPIGWFFLPPVEDDPDAHVGARNSSTAPLSAGEQVDRISPFNMLDEGFGAMLFRVGEMFSDPTFRGSIPRKYRTAFQERMARSLMAISFAATQAQLGNLRDEAEHLERVAGVLREAGQQLGQTTKTRKRRTSK